jgi:hypothetical protein
MRITNKQLECIIERLNKITGNATEPYTKTDNGFVANIGNYHISSAYGGFALHQMMNENGGIHDVFRCGYTTKRDLYNRIVAYIDSIDTGE